MTTTSDARVQFADSEVVSETLRTTTRRWLFWIVAAVVIILLAVGSLLLAGSTTGGDKLAATNPGASGAEALVNVLRTDGVTVHAPRTLKTAAKDAGQATASTTVVLYDPSSILTKSQLRTLKTIAPNLVLILPSAHELDILAPGVSEAGVARATASAHCDFAPAQRAGSVAGLQNAYRITSHAASETGCFEFDSTYSLVRVRGTRQTVTVLGSSTMLTNQDILEKGNAALALGLFGSTTHLVWYLPSLADVAGIQQDGNITPPPWVFMVEGLAALVVIAAAVWRGRRLGSIVVERMPVIVRSNETMEGRARLYQRSSARSHAIDSLRIGTISKIASSCGLPSLASVDDVIGAAARVTGQSVAELRGLLLDETPTTDQQLVRLSDRLLQLEQDVRHGVTAT